ncbi:MAG: tetratricopeptide repeat protein [Deltaproteobacteria bacterium]|nr:tetratricopeptide repeat protein [Deltaproteobacteria bacterium]
MHTTTRSTRSRWVAAALLAAFLALPTGHAQAGGRYSRTVQVKVKSTQTDRTRAIAPKDNKAQALPELNSDEVLSVEGEVTAIRNEQVAYYSELIDETSDAKERAEYLYQLADLHSRAQRFWRLRATELAIKADKNPKLKGKADDAAKQAKAEMVAAIKEYKKLTDGDEYKTYPQMDKALFYYGYTLASGKYMKDARVAYQRLLKEWPNSPFVPEALVSFADYYFEQNDLADAESFYAKVLQFPKASVYWYAYYKMGWVDLNLQKHNEALEAFFKVAQATQGDKKQATLNRAAKKDLVRAYAEVGNVRTAYKYFQKVDSSFAFDMHQILGDLFLEQGKAEKSIYVFRELMSLDGKNKNVCLWQYNVAHAMLTAGSNAQKVAEIENLVKLYGALKKGKVLPEAESSECHDNAAAMAGEMARAYHNESMKTLNPETLAYADKLYHVYLETFPDAEDYGETQYYYAELLWARADAEKNQRLQTQLWEDAAVAFTDVVKTNKVDKKLLKESAYASVLGWKNALDVDPRVKAPPPSDDKVPDKVPPPEEIPAREQKMLAAFDIYINYIKDPKDPELVGMKFLKANIYRRHNHFDEAIPVFEDILTEHRDHETALYSANLLLDSLNRLKRYDEMLVWVDKLQADKKWLEDKEDLTATLERLKRQSLRLKAQDIEARAKESSNLALYVQCGQAYIDIYNRDPEGEKGDEILYNAGTCFEQGKSIGAALTMFQQLRKTYPTSKLASKAIAKLGANFAAVAYYDKASDMFEEYAKKFGGEANARDVMSDAVFYRKGIGDDDKAIADTKFFIDTFGKKNKKDAADAFFSETSIYEKRGDNDKVISHLRQYLATYGAAGGDDRIIVAYAKIGEILWAQSCPGKTINGSCIREVRERAVGSKAKSKRRKGSDLPTQCGPETKIKLTPVARDEKKMKEALAAFGKAASEFEKRQGKTGGDEVTALYYYARAKFFQADKDYEAFLSIKFPTGLDFNPQNKAVAAKSGKRFNEWVETKVKAATKAREQYEALIFKVKDPSNAIAGAARIGQIQQHFSDQLFTAEIPTNVRTGPYAEDGVEAYCDALTEKAEPLEAKSLEAFGACLNESTKRGWFNEWSKLCERELGQIKPEEFPTASEVRGAPDDVAPITDVEPAVTKLE